MPKRGDGNNGGDKPAGDASGKARETARDVGIAATVGPGKKISGIAATVGLEKNTSGIAATVPTPVSLYGEELAPGASLGPYVIDEIVGRGGFACVYRAHHMSGSVPVAVKVLHNKLAYSPTIYRRFQREAETAQSFDHPSIVRIIEWGQLPNGRPFMVMEWLEGESLQDFMVGRGPMSIEDMLPVVKALCEPLAMLHERKLVHRDLKPSNVFVINTEPLELKLLDFGMVKLLEDDGRRLTSTGSPVGTPGYMAPEQIRGADVDAGVDVYALGVIMFQMLTGKLPFRAPTVVEVQELHLRATPPRVSDETPVPGSIDELISRCLEKQPEHRPQPVMDVYRRLVNAAKNPQRPTDRFASGQTRAIGVLVRCGDLERLEKARDAALDAGFALAMEDGSDFLVVKPLDLADPATRSEAVALARQLGSQPGVTIRIHEADASMLTIMGMVQITGGELLDLDAWPSAPIDAGIYVSDGVTPVTDIDSIEPVSDHPDILRLRIS